MGIFASNLCQHCESRTALLALRARHLGLMARLALAGLPEVAAGAAASAAAPLRGIR